MSTSSGSGKHNPETRKITIAFESLKRYLGSQSVPVLSHLKGSIEEFTGQATDEARNAAYKLLQDFVAKEGDYAERVSLQPNAERKLAEHLGKIATALGGRLKVPNKLK